MIFDLFKKEVVRTSADLDAMLQTDFSEAMSGVVVTPSAALQFAPVFACIRVLAESIGQLPLHMFKQKGDQKLLARDHGLFGLLYASPNSYQTSQEWRELVVAHLCLRGNHYSYINRVGGSVLELLPLNPDSVTVKQDENYEVRYQVQFSDGSRDILAADQVLHIKLQSIDGLTGISPIKQAQNAIGLGISTEKYGSLLFKNGGRPGGILTTEGKLSEDQVKLIRDQWNSTHGGGDNSHKVAIMQGGLTWASVSMAAEDAQFLETRKFQRSEIAGIFRVPPHMIGDLEKATFSNIENQGLEFVIHTLMPWLTRIEQRINHQLLTTAEKKRHFVKFNVRGLLRGDMKNRAEFYTKMVNMGAMSPNEIRELEDMNPRDGGDIYLTPLNMAINGETPEEDDANQEA